MANLELTTQTLSMVGILHVAMVVLGFVLWNRIRADNRPNREIKNIALLIAIVGIFVPTLSLLNVNLYAVSLLD